MDVFGSIFRRKCQVKSRLEGIMKAIDEAPTLGLIKLERKLKREWKEILLQEEIFWMQKSRIDWLRLGNHNTNFFSHDDYS